MRKRTKRHGTRKKKLRMIFVLALCCMLLWTFFFRDGAFFHQGVPISGREIPLLLQTDVRWANDSYGDGTVGEDGCGPTCVAMVIRGLLGTDVTPDEVADFSENNGYFSAGSGTSWALMTDGVADYGLSGQEIPLDRGSILNALESGHPIIASVREGDFTEKGHFIVLAEVADNGEIVVNDPNSKSLSKRTWPVDRLMPQIKNLWRFSPT